MRVQHLRSSLLGAVVLLALALVACGEDDGQTQDDPGDEGQADQLDDELESVTLALNWLPQEQAAAYYVALDQGWFEEEGLDVEIARGFGSGDTVKRVATGEAEFGITDLSGLVPLRVNEDVPVKAIASVYQEQPQAVIFRAGEGIEEPEDLEGRSIACSANNANMTLFPAFAEAVGIDADAVEWRLSEPGSHTAAFASGQADATCDFVTTQALINTMTDDELGYFWFAEHGVSGYGLMIVSSEEMIDERPEVVEGFLRAALRGIEFAVSEPTEAIDILLSYTPDNDPELAHTTWQLILDFELLTDELTEEHGLGYMDTDRMEAAFEDLLQANDLEPGEYTAEDLYTTEFLP